MPPKTPDPAEGVHKFNHYHACPSCKGRFGCDMEGCRDWPDKVCKKCYDEFFRKVTYEAKT